METGWSQRLSGEGRTLKSQVMALLVPAVPYPNRSVSCGDSCVRRPSEADRSCGYSSGWPQSQPSRSASAKVGGESCVFGMPLATPRVCQLLGVSWVGLSPGWGTQLHAWWLPFSCLVGSKPSLHVISDCWKHPCFSDSCWSSRQGSLVAEPLAGSGQWELSWFRPVTFCFL